MHTRAPFPLRHLAAAIPLTLALHAYANETSTQLATVEAVSYTHLTLPTIA